MDLKRIGQVLDSEVPDIIKEQLICNILSEDDKVIKIILSLLSNEREKNKELVSDMNLELSRTHICLENEVMYKENKDYNLGEIEKFYNKWKGIVRHCFNRFN